MKQVVKMTNTTVKITYSNDSTREFIASDELEKLINEGEMFSITTMHSDMGSAIELEVSKMYVGNPIAALGNMIIMRSNAEKIIEEGDNVDKCIHAVVETLNSCIGFISDETSSYQSNMTLGEYKPKGRQLKKGPSFGDKQCSEKCPAIKDICVHYRVINEKYKELVYYCGHSKNPQDGKCVAKACPRSSDYIPF